VGTASMTLFSFQLGSQIDRFAMHRVRRYKLPIALQARRPVFSSPDTESGVTTAANTASPSPT
jgi:hypothetical protein